MKRTALVTGITGFIGGAMAKRLLADGWGVHAVVRPQSDLSEFQSASNNIVFHTHDGSTENLAEIVRGCNPDVVFHLASLFLVDHRPDQLVSLLESNIIFSTQLLEAMALNGNLRLVNAGTSWQNYGISGYKPVNLYAATKQAFQDIISYYHDAKSLNCITLKLFDTYGPGDKRRKLINILVDAAISGNELDMSPGEQVIDLTHIEDVVSAFIQAGDMLIKGSAPRNSSYFVSGERFRLKELVTMVSDAYGKRINVHFGGRPYRTREVMLPADATGGALPNWRVEKRLDVQLENMAKASQTLF